MRLYKIIIIIIIALVQLTRCSSLTQRTRHLAALITMSVARIGLTSSRTKRKEPRVTSCCHINIARLHISYLLNNVNTLTLYNLVVSCKKLVGKRKSIRRIQVNTLYLTTCNNHFSQMIIIWCLFCSYCSLTGEPLTPRLLAIGYWRGGTNE